MKIPHVAAGQLLEIARAPEGYRSAIAAALARESDHPVLHIVEDDSQLAAAREAVRFFEPDLRVTTIPAWDCPPYSRISPHPEVSAARIAALSGIARRDGKGPELVVTTSRAAMQRIPAKETVLRNSRAVYAGRRFDYEMLKRFLHRVGYINVPKVSLAGEYAIRGAIVDVFPPGRHHPVRFDFFGDTVESIRRFDPNTQVSTSKLRGVRLNMLSEVVLDDDSIGRFRTGYRTEFGAPRIDDIAYQSITQGGRTPGIEHWLPMFHERLVTLFDFMPNSSILIDESARRQFGIHWDLFVESYRMRTDPGAGRIQGDNSVHVCRPETLLVPPEGLESLMARLPVARFRSDPLDGPGNLHDAGAKSVRDFTVERQQEGSSLMEAAAEHLKLVSRTKPAVVACWSNGSRDRLAVMLSDHGVPTHSAERFLDCQGRLGIVGMAVWSLPTGFVAPNVEVLSEQDLFGRRLVHQTRKRAANHLLHNEIGGLVPGELVVHVEHGIGRFVGLEVVEAANETHDCVVLEYRNGDRLYLPTVNINLLSRYGEDGPSLDRLGSVHWQERKARLAKDILHIAEQLMEVAAKRMTQSAPKLNAKSEDWNEFLARFQFVDTEGQRTASEEVLSDLRAGRPMDRLICGDVGFGKTEVAMRAAFSAVMSGHQVAVVAPTTLLARQHYERFRLRFSHFPVRIGQMSRLVDRQQVEGVREELGNGRLDIVIGTHAVLGEDVRFRNLALVVIDEEQAFGVLQKERIKQFRANVHVLAMTATPIPRTLKLALAGAKDFSLITTPPADRLAIRTYVLEFDPATIREALLREKYRLGQSFFVVPRIRDISNFVEFLTEQVPEVTFVSAHGQLSSGELEKRTNDFYEGRYDVLLSTTIIAAGLDIPTANTIVIANANRFGLAQLHQIRGRVGRSRTRAFAYITHNRHARLSDQAVQRLSALRSADSLGAGFSLAAQDMDIRGAGNLLGQQQSGHVKEVGYELYQKMLEAAINSVKSGSKEDRQDPEEDWAPQLSLGVSAMIPANYVGNQELRLGLYRRLTSLTTDVEIEGMASEMVDRFGRMPEEVLALLDTLKIKLLSKRANVGRLDAGPKGLTLRFRNDDFPNPEALHGLVESKLDRAQFHGPRLTFRRNWTSPMSRMRGTLSIVGEIADLVPRA